MCFRLVWGLSLFEVAILLKCLLMPGSPFCRGQWLWKSQTCTKKKGWAPWFCRENSLLDLWQVPHSFCRGLGPQKSDLALQNGDTQPPQVIFWGYSFWIYNLQYQTGMKCGTLCWSNLKIAERGENFSQRQKSSGKKQMKPACRGKSWKIRASTKSTSESSWFLYFKHWSLYKMHFFLRQFLKVLWINF